MPSVYLLTDAAPMKCRTCYSFNLLLLQEALFVTGTYSSCHPTSGAPMPSPEAAARGTLVCSTACPSFCGHRATELSCYVWLVLFRGSSTRVRW
jgi:hypothetical protein